MTRLLRQKLEESLRRYLRERSEITLAAGLTLSRMIQDDQAPSEGLPRTSAAPLCSTAAESFQGLARESNLPFNYCVLQEKC